MAASVGGHIGGLPLTKMLDIIDRYAYKQRHVAWSMVGVRKGLPPDVVTVQIGTPDDGTWWNLKRGMMPEHSVHTKGGVVDNEETLELMDKYGMNPLAKAARQGIAKRPGAMSLFNENSFKQTLRPKLLYIGWRSALASMMENRSIRGSAEAEQLLGTKQYREIMIKRLARETVYYDESDVT